MTSACTDSRIAYPVICLRRPELIPLTLRHLAEREQQITRSEFSDTDRDRERTHQTTDFLLQLLGGGQQSVRLMDGQRNGHR